MASRDLKKFSGDGGGGPYVNIVSVHVLYISFFSFSVSSVLCQVTSGYVRLGQFTLEGQDVELDNN